MKPKFWSSVKAQVPQLMGPACFQSKNLKLQPVMKHLFSAVPLSRACGVQPQERDPGGNFPFTFDVRDADGNKLMDQVFYIHVIEDRSPPSIITNKGLVLDENSAKTIRTLQLSATDQDSEASQLQFKVTQQPQLGHLEHVASPGTRISSFSQADLASGSIQYIHTSDVEKHTDAFTFSVSDGTNEHLPDGSAPSAHAEFYLLPDPYEVSRRKTRTAPRGSDPTYNELVSTIHFLPPLLVSWNHGMGQAGRAHSGHLVPPPSSSRAIPEHVAQDCVQMVLGYHR
ncbi:FRAS1-related extracellular matrix protein 2-like isoform X2 [Poecile atricapillus]|uniref:FRAS1-related extracellular matrix protein 2-like isoform X2 n=1 Tax=Poecile atricapillus TaxID=48891 RepID=UPI002739952F|nr:FRAS1-related extracellular matrix protein 2-like isoform X2 [Poecile atricapillus]